MQASGILPWHRSRLYERAGKRAFDLAVTALFSPLWVPLTMLLWLLSWLEAGQGFYTEQRVGRHGHLFRCVKIRTMRCGTLRKCAAVKTGDDPRVTPWGRFLRRASLDELPQLFCVLRGEMSLVGPRPVPASELARYGFGRAQYLALRPGLTGLWQVSGRNALPYSARIALDGHYGREVSLIADVRILLATCREVWRMSGR
ncbi:MAG: sugar transferase [Thalassovita sp.]